MAASAIVHLCNFVARTRCPGGDMAEERQASEKGGRAAVHGHAFLSLESGYRHAS